MEGSRISHYQVGALVGMGGMSEVYEATDLNLGRRVALKFLRPELSVQPRILKREARSAAALNHPNIATLHAYEPDGVRPFIAMEWVSGPSLRTRIEGGALPVREALMIAKDVAAGLAHAHRAGVVHGDIKPENLMLDAEGVIKIMDFGLARATFLTTTATPQPHFGTPLYMAPEAALEPPEAPADVFALGLVLYEMLAGRPAFNGQNASAILYAIANLEPTPLRELRNEVPQDVQDLIASVLSKQPRQRPSAAEVAKTLAEMTGSEADLEGDSRRAELRPLLWVAVVAVVAVGGLWLSKRADTVCSPEAIALNNQAIDALQGGEKQRAKSLILEALRQDPDCPKALLNRGNLYELDGQLDSAAFTYSRILDSKRYEPMIVARASYAMGSIDLQGHAWSSAVSHFGQSFEMDSSVVWVFNSYAFSLVMVGRAAEGLAVAERGIDRFPGEAFLYRTAGLAALKLGHDREALRFLDTAAQLDPLMTSAVALRALALARTGDVSGAAAAWKSVSGRVETESDGLGFEPQQLRAMLEALGVQELEGG